MVRNAKAQFERRGGFVRIFPAADTWAKYSQYLGKVLFKTYYLFYQICLKFQIRRPAFQSQLQIRIQ